MPNEQRGSDESKKWRNRDIYKYVNQTSTSSWIDTLRTMYLLKLQKREKCWNDSKEMISAINKWRKRYEEYINEKGNDRNSNNAEGGSIDEDERKMIKKLKR